MRPALLALLILAAACGKSQQERAHDRIRATCLGLQAAGATVRDADSAFAGAYRMLWACSFPAQPDLAACDPAALFCKRTWWWFATDAALCGPFGCWFACEVWSPEKAAEPRVSDQPVCGARFFDETCPIGLPVPCS
ncbi:MAG TPA: hypothetical protein VH880_02545 [Anaeromyxobacteraceae bacterium]